MVNVRAMFDVAVAIGQNFGVREREREREREKEKERVCPLLHLSLKKF